MARASVAEMMEALFAPLVTASGRSDLASRLRTADLPQDRLHEQYRRLATTKMVGDYLLLPPDSFLVRYRNKDSSYLCVQTESVDSEARMRLSDWGRTQGLSETFLEESAFLFLVHSLRGLYRPKSAFLTREGAENVIDIVKPGYIGHSIYDVQALYQDLTTFEIPEDHIFRSQTSFGVAANLAGLVPDFRSDLTPPAVAGAIARLNQLPNINPENLYFALTSSHWKHLIIELYKCLEAAFYLPSGRALRDALGQKIDALALAIECKLRLGWRENHAECIVSLFGLLPEATVVDPALGATVSFSDVQALSSAFATRIYKIRNQLVHQFDYEQHSTVRIDADAWPALALYLCTLLHSLYSTFAADIPYKFEIPQSEQARDRGKASP